MTKKLPSSLQIKFSDEDAERLAAIEARLERSLRLTDGMHTLSPADDAFCEKLLRVAELYLRRLYEESLPRTKPGRPPNLADDAFCHGMIIALAKTLGESPRLRTTNNGREVETLFQKICNLWLLRLDPTRGRLKPTAFRKGQKDYQKRQQRKYGGNSPSRSK